MSPLSTEEAWKKIFSKYAVLEALEKEPHFTIASHQINEFREARLMTKFDSRAQLPAIFKKNGLAILPVTRGSYAIGRYKAYAELDYPASVPRKVSPPDCQSVDCINLYSESAALSFAFNAGIIDEIMETRNALFTVSGRMSSGCFAYTIDDLARPHAYSLSVNNAQIEIDAGYESKEHFCIVEAKNVAPEDFLIRQLYYPYRLWSTKLAKPVQPVFLVFSNNMFTAFSYAFSGHTHYNALQLLKVQRFVIADEEIALAEVRYFLESFHDFREPEVQFPQADSFERVVDLLGILAERPLSREEITERYAFDKRQTNYYSDAGRYLGLLEKEREGALIVYRLTPAGRTIMRKRPKDKTLGLIRAILSRNVFNEACKITLSTGHPPSNERLAAVFAQAGLAIPINATTMARRSSTVRKWVDWILQQCV